MRERLRITGPNIELRGHLTGDKDTLAEIMFEFDKFFKGRAWVAFHRIPDDDAHPEFRITPEDEILDRIITGEAGQKGTEDG